VYSTIAGTIGIVNLTKGLFSFDQVFSDGQSVEKQGVVFESTAYFAAAV